MASQTSSLTQATSGGTGALNIPRPEGSAVAGSDAFRAENDAGVLAAGALPHRAGQALQGTGLPTPPNSISPNLEPEAFRAKLAQELVASPPVQVDSDIDLEDAVAHANIQDQPEHGPGDDGGIAEGVGSITPAYLARHHLADVILKNGPIAIRHVMTHLSTNVPGFSEIPPAKARRIVVAALETRAGGGLNGDVQFEKVGWGRWNARLKGQPFRDDRTMYSIREGNVPSPASNSAFQPPAMALSIPGGSEHPSKLRRLSHGSWTAESTMSNRSERGDRADADVAEHGADAMSIDGEEEGKHHSLGQRLPIKPMANGHASDTDEEDWSKIDVAALRAQAMAAGGRRPPCFTTSMRRGSRSKSRSYSPHPRSLHSHSKHNPNHTHQQHQHRNRSNYSHLDFSGVSMDTQERDAIEALLHMGST